MSPHLISSLFLLLSACCFAQSLPNILAPVTGTVVTPGKPFLIKWVPSTTDTKTNITIVLYDVTSAYTSTYAVAGEFRGPGLNTDFADRISAAVDSTKGNYTWNVPVYLNASDRFVLRFQLYLATHVFQLSDSFSIGFGSTLSTFTITSSATAGVITSATAATSLTMTTQFISIDTKPPKTMAETGTYKTSTRASNSQSTAASSTTDIPRPISFTGPQVVGISIAVGIIVVVWLLLCACVTARMRARRILEQQSLTKSTDLEFQGKAELGTDGARISEYMRPLMNAATAQMEVVSEKIVPFELEGREIRNMPAQEDSDVTEEVLVVLDTRHLGTQLRALGLV